jgi:hypothetical protein
MISDPYIPGVARKVEIRLMRFDNRAPSISVALNVNPLADVLGGSTAHSGEYKCISMAITVGFLAKGQPSETTKRYRG